MPCSTLRCDSLSQDQANQPPSNQSSDLDVGAPCRVRAVARAFLRSTFGKTEMDHSTMALALAALGFGIGLAFRLKVLLLALLLLLAASILFSLGRGSNFLDTAL